MMKVRITQHDNGRTEPPTSKPREVEVDEGGFDGYAHDAQVVTYNGPDSDYTGKEIAFASNEDHVEIVDVTNKSNPVQIASFTYPGADYTHQNWLTEDRNYLLVGDEGDEFQFGFNTRTIVFNVSDLDNIQLHMEYEGETNDSDQALNDLKKEKGAR